MTLDIKPFVKLVKQRDAKKSWEWLEANKGTLDQKDEFYKGYLLALQGMVAALESGSELSTISKTLEKKYTQEQVADLLRGAKSRAAQKFRAKDEQGFNTAWVDFLNELSGEKP
jgi:hypothetical protein